MRNEPEVAVLGAMIDDTYERVYDACRNPRTLNRSLLVTLTDIWVTYVFPAVGAATRPTHRKRQSAARELLAHLGQTSGRRRDWLEGHVRAAGLDPTTILGETPPAMGHYLDHQGHVHAIATLLTPQCTDLIETDYDLRAARFDYAHIEVSGEDSGPITVSVTVSTDRRRFAHPPTSLRPDGQWLPAKLTFSTGKPLRFSLPRAGGGPESLCGPPVYDVAADRAGVQILGVTVIEAPLLSYSVDDMLWHLSTAAIAAEPDAPRPYMPVPTWPIRGDIGSLAFEQFQALLQMRNMRISGQLNRWDLMLLSAACRGLGSETIAAATRSTRRARNRAARAALDRLSLRRSDVQWTQADRILVHAAKLDATERFEMIDFVGGRLRMFIYDGKRDEIRLHIDAFDRANGQGIIANLTLGGASCTYLELDRSGLDIIGPLTTTASDNGLVLTIPLRAGDCTIRAEHGRWRAS